MTLEPQSVNKLADAMQMLANAMTALPDTQSFAALKAFLSQLSVGGDGSVPPDPVKLRTARDYDVIRGLLGRAGAPRSLPMTRDGDKGSIVIAADVPDLMAVVQAPGKTETVQVGDDQYVELSKITNEDPVLRVELVDADGRLVAFGPYLPPVTSPDPTTGG